MVALDIHKSRSSGASHAVYLQGSGALAVFELDLTCLECRLFRTHAAAFVQRHPVFLSLSARQRAELVELAMRRQPPAAAQSESNK